MAIEVKVTCSDCGTVSDQILKSGDKEIICPDCRRNMPNLPSDDFKQVEKTLKSQSMLGLIALLLGLAALVLLYFWADPMNAWVSKAGHKEGDVVFFAAAAGCMLVAAILGALASRKRFVVEI